MSICVVILAAGRGKRMKSSKPKVLHEVLGKPMLQYPIDAVKALKPKRLVVVVGSGAEYVKNYVSINEKSVFFVSQKKLTGTGNAMIEARKALKGFDNTTIIVLNGDSPLITAKTLKNLLKNHQSSKNALSFLSFVDNSVSGYGRVWRDEQGKVIGIIEDKHTTLSEKRRLKELNGGIYAMEPEILNYLDRLKIHSSSGEYYLTDVVSIVAKLGKRVDAYQCPLEELQGINTREDLWQASKILNRRNISKWMKRGVTFIDPDTSVVHSPVSIGVDTVIYPNTYLEGNTSIGKNCIIYPGARIYGSALKDRVIVKDSTLIENSSVGDGSTIGPFAHLRPHSHIGQNVRIGNFVEIKKSTIKNGSKASHLSYIGDAEIGECVNIGAGTITCNYDGQKKYPTVIESGVFVGSDSQLVAPVKIGKGAYIAAGSTITKDVPVNSLAVGRAKQENIKDWKIKRKLKNKQ